MKQNINIVIFITLGVLVLGSVYYFGSILNERIETNKFPSNPELSTGSYQQIVDIFSEKEIYEFRDNSGWLEVRGIDIDYEKKKASIESTPLAIDSISYEEAIKQSGFTEQELFDLINKLELLGFTRAGLITNQVAPEQITLYGFCSNDECYKGVIYLTGDATIDSVKKAILQTSDIEIIPTTNPHLFLFATDDEYWL